MQHSSKTTLFVTRYYPIPAHDGALQYTSQLIGVFAKLTARVNVLCQYHLGRHDTCQKWEGKFPKNVTFFTGRSRHPFLWDKVFTRLPHSAIAHGTKENLRRLERRLRDHPSWIVVDHIGSAWVTDALRAYKQENPATQIIYCTHNMERDTRTSLLKTSYSRPHDIIRLLIDIYRIDRTERKMASLANVVTCISSLDQVRYRQIYDMETSVVITPIHQGAISPARTIDARLPRRICLVGSFEWLAKKKNLTNFLCESYVPLASRDIEIFVVGRMDPTYREKLRTRWPKVTFTGEVPEVQSYMASCRIGIIAEAVGGGFKLKSLEYIFNRVPIFALENAIIDLPLVAGKSIEIFSDLRGLCHGIAEKIDDVSYLNDMQKLAFDACSDLLGEVSCPPDLVTQLESSVG